MPALLLCCIWSLALGQNMEGQWFGTSSWGNKAKGSTCFYRSTYRHRHSQSCYDKDCLAVGISTCGTLFDENASVSDGMLEV